MKIKNHGIDASGTHVQEVLARVLVGKPPEKQDPA
jgi:hypothetical protein